MKDGAFEEGEFNRSLSTIVYVCAILTIVSFWLIQLESVLKPFFIALAVYFVLKPGADALSANGFPLVLSYFTMLMGFFAVVGAAGFFAYVQADTLMSDTATVEEYNAAVQTDVPFNPAVKDGRGTVGLDVPKTNWANRLDTPPYEAYAITCGITFTFGGIRIDTQGQVIDADGNQSRGLYAAGELVGGLFYFNYPGGTGLMSGAVFGKIAGTSAGQSVSTQSFDR